MDVPTTGETRVVWTLVCVSVLFHLIVYLTFTPGLMRQPMPMYEEWEIEAQLVADVDLSAADIDSLPKSEEAKEAKIPDNLLPQLPKKFEIDEKTKGETVAEEGQESPNEKTDKKAAKDSDEKKEVKENEEEKNKLKKNDAIRRLAIERLRKEQKISNKMEAQQRDKIAKLREKAASNKDIDVSAASGLSAGSDKYLGKLRGHIRRCYSVPAAYNLENAELVVAIAVVVNERGGLMSSSIKGPSGDQVFDDLAFKAVKDCSPLPPPPKKLAGTAITLNFTP